MSETVSVEEFEKTLRKDRERITGRMAAILPPPEEPPETLHQAMRYSSLEGGKRLRGLLCLWSHRMFGDPHPSASLDAACALEFLHAYTLIHDDLPSLDNDDTRRGKPSCHIKFGVALSILAGDALQALAFETLSACPCPEPVNLITSVNILAAAAGSKMLVGGQAADLEGEGKTPREETVQFIHSRKTAELISASLAIGAALALGDSPSVSRLQDVGRDVGLAFQIVDDLLDEEGEEITVGKSLRKDLKRGKITWPACYGVKKSRENAGFLIGKSAARIRDFGDRGLLDRLFHLILDRAS